MSSTSFPSQSTITATLVNSSGIEKKSINPFRFLFKSKDINNLSTQSPKHKKWRWWNILSFFLFVLVIMQCFNIFSTFQLINEDHFPIRILKRQYPFKAYTHLDTNVESQIEKGTRVYHVTKEFGPATLTEIGKTVTALSAAQQASNQTEVAVVMPFYTFMRRHVTDKEIDMVIDIRGKKPGQIMSVEFRVWKMMYAFNPPVQAPSVYEWQMINNINTSVLLTPQRPAAPTDVIPVYMIGFANRKPFNQAFKCRSVEEINMENELPMEWRDQYFAKAAAAFLAHKATASDEESIFAPIRIVPRVDIVHIHGVSNAYVAKFLQDKKEADDLGPRPPAIVYTMYDHEKEMQYTNTFRNVRKFLDQLTDREELRKYVYGGRMYMAKLAMDRAEAVVYANRSMAAEVIEGRKDFHLKELIMDALLKKAEGARFYGINNAIDYHSTEHPFITDKLIHRNMGFPRYAFDLILDQSAMFSSDPLRPLSLELPSEQEPTYWTLSEDPEDFVFAQKDRAKRFLIKRGILTEDDLTRPVVLYRGNLAKRAGLDALINAAPLFEKYNMRLVIMGEHKNYPMDKLEAIRKKYPDHIEIVTGEKPLRLSVFVRAAADFVIDPYGKKEHDDTKIAEGMLFGAAAITTGTGILRDALINRPLHLEGQRQVSVAHLTEDMSEQGAVVTSYEYYNSYIYNNGKGTLETALRDASVDFEKLLENNALREEFILRMIRSAVNLGWDKGHYHGPVHEYNQVYQLALEDRFIPTMRRHEVEQEHELVSRLQETSFDWEIDYK